MTVISVDHRADQGVVDGVPHLHEQEQAGHNNLVDADELSPVNRQRSFEGKAHVTAEVAGRIAELIHHAEFTQALAIGGGCVCHVCISSLAVVFRRKRAALCHWCCAPSRLPTEPYLHYIPCCLAIGSDTLFLFVSLCGKIMNKLLSILLRFPAHPRWRLHCSVQIIR